MTELGIVTFVKPLQLLNAEEPMVVTELGMVTLVNPLQLLNAEEPMVTTDDGIVTVLILDPLTKLDGSVFTELPMVTFLILAGIPPLDAQSTAFHVNSVITRWRN